MKKATKGHDIKESEVKAKTPRTKLSNIFIRKRGNK